MQLNIRNAFGSRRIVVGVTLAVFAGFAVFAWFQWGVQEYLPRNFGVVRVGAIYRSGQHSPHTLRELCEEYHFKTILDLGGAQGYDRKTQAQRDLAAELGIERFEFHLPSDGTGDPDAYVRVLQLMNDPARQPVLVHCGAGAQRTSTAVILFRTVIEGQTISEAYPESFGFKHESEQWELLAYLADNYPWIRDHYRAAVASATTNPADPGTPPVALTP